VTVRAAGDGSADVLGLRPGTRVLIEGPYGRLGAPARTRQRVVLIGAGVGITPLRALAEELPYLPGEAVLLHRYPTEPLFDRELDVLARERGLRVVRLPGHRRGPDSWLGHGVGEVSDLDALRWWVPDIAHSDVYVCGPPPWTDLVRRDLARAGVRPEHIHLETFAW
jgi:ferredoxin-NADP reductase